VGLLLIFGCVAEVRRMPGGRKQEIARKLKSKISPVYPELARRMKRQWSGKGPDHSRQNGTIKNTKLVAATRFLPTPRWTQSGNGVTKSGSEETIGVVEFRFDPAQ